MALAQPQVADLDIKSRPAPNTTVTCRTNACLATTERQTNGHFWITMQAFIRQKLAGALGSDSVSSGGGSR
jgi:hypothetical protein